jgi:hypothetical protein
MQPIRIAVGDVTLDGELNDTEGARRLARALPLTSGFQVWGDEIHFDVPVEPLADRRAQGSASVGDLGLCAGEATLCIFFGPTPSSPAEEPVPARPVTIVGSVRSAERLRGVKEADQISLGAAAAEMVDGDGCSGIPDRSPADRFSRRTEKAVGGDD